jgi:flagellar motor switch protein FliG
MIIVEGIHAIQLGFSDAILIEVLLSLFGEDYLLENKSENYADNLLNQITEYSNFYRKIKNAVLPNIDSVKVTPKEFRKLLLCDSKGIQKIVREIDSIFIVRAIKNLDLDFKKLFYENILERSAKLLFQKERETEVSIEEELEARSRILFILNKLLQSGEITLEGSDYGLFL